MTRHITGAMPNSRTMENVPGRRPPKGGRNSLGRTPVAASMALEALLELLAQLRRREKIRFR